MGEFKKYDLTDTELVKISRLCVQEQGTKGAPYEASLMCNLYELYGHNYSSLYNYVRNSGWFYKAAYFMDHGDASSTAIESVRKVICNGNRLFPRYIDEHDQFSDIEWVKNNGKKVTKTDRSAYIPNVTKIKNTMGSEYTFYTFPTQSSDPFGYTDNKYAPSEQEDRVVMCLGNDVNFREGAGTGFPSIAKLDGGETLIQKGVSGAWVKAEYKNKLGFIHSKYVGDLVQIASSIISSLSGTYSTAELRTIIEQMQKLVV